MFKILWILPILLVLILIPSILIAGLLKRKSPIGKAIITTYITLFILMFILFIIGKISQKMVLSHEDFYGEYTVNKEYFEGRQAKWQYNHFRFEITEKDSILFHVTEEDYIIKTYRGVITTHDQHESSRLVIEMEQPTHHILTSNPTIYREAWNFNLVFNSPKFHNMYFHKEDWLRLNL